ncbi:hypothetical protein NE579_16635, partial [Intestinimonas massiliensis]|nr:hypothetical protein [Intestinimonas massiliensis (ex Afouda et al. 2020)]
MILGSGLGFLGDVVEDPVCVSYRDIPHFKASTAPGHKGRLVFVQADANTLIAAERITIPVAVVIDLPLNFAVLRKDLVIQ